LILAGSVAAASAVIFGAIGVAIFGEDMWPNRDSPRLSTPRRTSRCEESTAG
jgi:hypothetical protein